MRLWHQELIHHLDDKRLLSQHRECCALRGKGWGRKHRVVDYVFKYNLMKLYTYHRYVMTELKQRNFKFDHIWYNQLYRGKSLGFDLASNIGTFTYQPFLINDGDKIQFQYIYEEHDDKYLKECLLNLKAKSAKLINGYSIDAKLVELDLKGI